MKKSLKCLISMMMVVTFIVPGPSIIKANETNQIIAVQTSQNEMCFFSTQEDYQCYLKNRNSSNNEVKHRGDFVTTVEVSRQNLYMKFVGYHSKTPVWTKADSYTIRVEDSVTVSTQGVFDGMNYTLELTKTVGVDTNIPADATKYSRLGIYGDFLVKHMRDYLQDQNGIYGSYDYISTQTLNSYINVTYK